MRNSLKQKLFAIMLVTMLSVLPMMSLAEPEQTDHIEQTVFGSQAVAVGDQYYISIGDMPQSKNGAVLVYDINSRQYTILPTASNISQLVYTDDALFALTAVQGGVSLIRITDICEVLTTATLIDQLSVYDGKLFFLADGKLTSINPDGTELHTYSRIDVGEYVISDDTAYFTNMDDAKSYSVNSRLQSAALTLKAGCLYSINLNTGVQLKLLSNGVKSIKAGGGDIYLQYMGESYAANIGGTEQPAGRLCRFEPSTRRLERVDVQNECSYFPTDDGLIVHSESGIELYRDCELAAALLSCEQTSVVYAVDTNSVVVYEPAADRLTLVTADTAIQPVVLIGTATQGTATAIPTLLPPISNGTAAIDDGLPTKNPTYTSASTTYPTYAPRTTTSAAGGSLPTVKPTAEPKPTARTLAGIIFQDSNVRRLTEAEIRALDDDQLIYGRYEILARNGYVFKDQKYLKYYRQFDWYKEDASFKFADLNDIEHYNYELFRSIMNDIFATPTPAPTAVPTPRPTNAATDYAFIFPDAMTRKLSREEIESVPRDKLLQGRYEILARAGYVFDTKSWQQYFEKQDWYAPVAGFKFGDMNEIESYNYELIRSVDKGTDTTPTAKPTQSASNFIFPDAMTRKLTRDEVLAVGQAKLFQGRYEILARAGYIFNDAEWQKYFEQQNWYQPKQGFKFSDLNAIESYNYELIRSIDKELGGGDTVSPSPFIFPDALTRKLTREEVIAVGQSKLFQGRYEILARHGYVFKDKSWQQYFESQSWYTKNADFAFDDMTNTESYNYSLIRSIDEELQNSGGTNKNSDALPTPPPSARK